METLSSLLDLYEGNPPITDSLNKVRASNAKLWFFFAINLSKLLNKK